MHEEQGDYENCGLFEHGPKRIAIRLPGEPKRPATAARNIQECKEKGSAREPRFKQQLRQIVVRPVGIAIEHILAFLHGGINGDELNGPAPCRTEAL